MSQPNPMPKDGPTTKVEIMLRRVLQKGNWSDTCDHLFRAILQSDDTPRTAPDSGLTSTWFFLRL